MSRPLVQREDTYDSLESEGTFMHSKRSCILGDITNLSSDGNLGQCKRYKSGCDKFLENFNLAPKSLAKAQHRYNGNDEHACRTGELHSQMYSVTKNMLKGKDIDDITQKSSDTEPSKTPACGNEEIQYLPQYLKGARMISSPNFIGDQINAATHNSQSCFGTEKNLLDGDKEHIRVLFDSDECPLTATGRLSVGNRVVASAAFSFPDDVSKGSPGISSARKSDPGIQEACDKRCEEILATNGSSCVESSDVRAIRKTADMCGITLSESSFNEDVRSNSKVTNLWRTVSGHDKFGSDKSDTVQNCSCSFCCKAAYIWSDLNYHDVRGRLLVLRKSMANAASLIGGNFFRDLASTSNKQTCGHSSIPEHAKRTLELHLMYQWRSLFLQTQKALNCESMQLQSSLHKLKELRENCKKDLEVIHNACANDLQEELS